MFNRDLKNPGFDIFNLGELLLMPPAFEKRLLQGIAGVFQIADQANSVPSSSPWERTNKALSEASSTARSPAEPAALRG